MTLSGSRPLIAPIRTLRVLSVSVLVTPALLGAVVFLAVPSAAPPPPLLPLLLGAVAVGGVLLAETVGYAAPPLVPGTDAHTAGAAALSHYRSRWFVRALSTEAVLLVGLLLALMLGTFWPYAVAFVLGWPIMVYEVWPAQRITDKLNLRLQGNGALSYLDEALHGRLP